MKKSLGIDFLLCGAALFAALYTPAPAMAQPNPQLAIAVRPTGEADVVTIGPNGGVYFYYATPGSQWASYTIINFDLEYGPTPAGPAIVIGADGQPYVAAEGPAEDSPDTVFAYQPSGSGAAGESSWSSGPVFGLKQNYEQDPLSVPAIAERPNAEVDIVYQSIQNSLVYEYREPPYTNCCVRWNFSAIAGPGTTFSAAAIVVRPDGEADIVAQGPDNSLLYYHATPGSPWHADTIAGNHSTFSTPAIVVRSDGEADVVAQGPNNSLRYYHATPGSAWDANTIAEDNTTYSAPAIAVRSDGEADVVARGSHNSLRYHHAMPGSAWDANTIAGDNTTYSAPAIAVRSDGEADVVAQGPHNSLRYYHATPGSAWDANTIAGDNTTY